MNIFNSKHSFSASFIFILFVLIGLKEVSADTTVASQGTQIGMVTVTADLNGLIDIPELFPLPMANSSCNVTITRNGVIIFNEDCLFFVTNDSGTYIDTEVIPGTHYTYVLSYSASQDYGCVESESCMGTNYWDASYTPAIGWAAPPTPPQVTGLWATQGTLYGKSTVSWPPSSGATGYDIYQSTTFGSLGNLIVNNYGETSYDDYSAATGSYYYYTVVAKNSYGSAPASAQALGYSKVPGVISDLTATQGTQLDQVQLNWTANPDATSYQIWRSTVSGGTASLIATTTSPPPYVNTHLMTPTHYFYTVKVVVGSSVGEISNAAMGYALIPPSQVTNVSATQGTLYGKSTISWLPNPTATSYDIYRSTVAGSKGMFLSNTTQSSLDDNTVSGATHYFYTVVSKNVAGVAPDSSQAEGWGKIPSTVSDLTATKGILQNKVGMSWSINPDATGYQVWRSMTSGGPYTQIATLGVLTIGYYEDKPLIDMTHYFYIVKPVVGTVEGLPSNESLGYAIVATAKVLGVTATQGTVYGKSTISWTPDPFTSGYDIYRSTAVGTKGYLLTSVGITSIYDDNIGVDTPHYFYTVVAKNSLGVSPDSNQAEGWAKIPGTISDLTASQGTQTDQVQLNWTPNTDATAYQILKSTTSGGTDSLVTTTSPPPYIDAPLADATHYYYTVKVVIGTLVGQVSNEAMGYALVSAQKVLNVTATQGTLYGKCELAWTPNPTATGYDIYRSAAAGSKGSLLVSSVTEPPYDDNMGLDNTHYFYTVVAKNALGVSTDSDQAEGWAKVPRIISDLAASQGTVTDKVRLTWTPVSDATGYEIWQSTTAAGVPTKIATASASPYDDSTVSGAAVYYYTVKAVVGTLVGSNSNQASGYANKAPKAVSLSINSVSASSAPSSATLPEIIDPNIVAKEPESLTYAVLSQPSAGTVTASANGFVYTPSPTSAISGNLSFTFSVTDKGGATINGTGHVVLYCSAVINNINLSSFYLEQTPLNISYSYNLGLCAPDAYNYLQVSDGMGQVVVNSDTYINGNGDNIQKTITIPPLLSENGPYYLFLQITPDTTYPNEDYQLLDLNIEKINLPQLTVNPSLNVSVGDNTQINATLTPPANVNCPFTTNLTQAQADPTQCYVNFTAIPPGLTQDTSGALPKLTGIVTDGGRFPITATISKSNGTSWVDIGTLTQSLVSGCVDPDITGLTGSDNVLPFVPLTFDFKYSTFACAGSATGVFQITQNAKVIFSQPLTITTGQDVDLPQAVNGLDAGNYTVSVSITNANGVKNVSKSLTVKAVPMPMLVVTPNTVSQSDGLVNASLMPSMDQSSCPLTTVQTDAEADPTKCFVALSTTLTGMQTYTDSNGLPTLSGYPSVAGTFNVQAQVSRWVNGIRYDSAPLIQQIVVTPVVEPVYVMTDLTSVYVNIQQAKLTLQQKSGENCYLYLYKATAQISAAAGKRACFVTFTGNTQLKVSLSANQAVLSGTFATTGTKTIGYNIQRAYANGMTADVQSGQEVITVIDMPPPTLTFTGGSKITTNEYYVAQGQPIALADVSTNVPTNSLMSITVTDSQQNVVRKNIMSGGSFWISTPKLGFMAQRLVTVRAAWQDYPTVYSEQVLTAIGGTPNNMKLTLTAPNKINDTNQLNLTAAVGTSTSAGTLSYDQSTMGQWQTQILAQTNTISNNSPVTSLQDMTNGTADFTLSPAGNLYMKVTAVAKLVSNIDGLTQTLTSNTHYVEVVKGSPITGTITAPTLEAPSPSPFVLTLNMSVDNRVAMKQVVWQQSVDGGNTWSDIANSNALTHTIYMTSPGKMQVRVKMSNKNTLADSYTDQVELWAYSKLDASITGPNNMAPGQTATFASVLYQKGVATTDTVNEWILDTPSGTVNSTGPTATITESKVGTIYVTLKTRPSDTLSTDPKAWTVVKDYLIVTPPGSPRLTVDGLREVEVGKSYHYTGTIHPSWGNATSVNTIVSQWQLPDGTIVPGTQLDWTPSERDLAITRPQLTFSAWVEGYQGSTSSISISAWQYIWPNWSIALKQPLSQAPSDIALLVSHDTPSMNQHFDGLTYAWTFPSGVTGRQNSAFANESAGQAVYTGDYAILVTMTDNRGNKTTLTQPVTATQAKPYTVTMSVTDSNIYSRAPMAITLRPTIYGGHPLDSVLAQTWSIDGVVDQAYTNRNFLYEIIPSAGNHIISYTMHSKMGQSVTVNTPVSLVPNKPPVCSLSSVPNGYVVYAQANCTDTDGKVVGYSWLVNGKSIASTTYKVSFSKLGPPQSANVSVTAVDDAGESSNAASITVDY